MYQRRTAAAGKPRSAQDGERMEERLLEFHQELDHGVEVHH